ncbi:MAG: hypothetical protein HDQ88_12025 [Clostridia bacterium]|nr:hypothetical protein [Clostridia bacterium]
MSEMKSGVSLIIVIVVVFCTTLGMWWYTVNDNRAMASEIARLKEDMGEMLKHMEDSKRFDEAIESLRKGLQKRNSDMLIQQDYLIELIEKDVEIHCGEKCLPAAPPVVGVK